MQGRVFRRFAGLMWLGFGVGIGPIAVQADAPDPAESVVERFQSSLIAAMKSGAAAGFDGRQERLAPVVRESFDFPMITRLVLGGHWKQLAAEQRAQTESALERLAIATLASRFDRYQGERFVVKSSKRLRHGGRRVRSEFVESGGGITPVDYTLHRVRTAWQIVNVWFDGVSGTTIHRREFDSVIRRNGFPALIDLLEKQIAAYIDGG